MEQDAKFDSEVNLLKDMTELLVQGMAHESDRGVALVAAEFFDVTLEKLLRARFENGCPKNAKLVEPLFDALGPLSTFSAKIRLCHAINLLQAPIASDLDLIRRIRNKFSHSLESRTFRDSEIKTLVDQLSGSEDAKRLAAKVGLKLPEHFDARFSFSIRCARLGALLESKIITEISEMPEDQKRKLVLEFDVGFHRRS
jgi:DNA-binding MltR family transcriptional regulator